MNILFGKTCKNGRKLKNVCYRIYALWLFLKKSNLLSHNYEDEILKFSSYLHTFTISREIHKRTCFFVMISFTTGKQKKVPRKFLFTFSTVQTEKNSWKKIVKTSDEFVMKYYGASKVLPMSNTMNTKC